MKFAESILKQSDLFKSLNMEALESLAKICHKKKVEKKEILFLEGDPGRAFFLCVTGNIQLYKGTKEGREIVIKMIKPGEVFAEVILFEQDYYPVSAMAIRRSELLMIPKEDFDQLLTDIDFRTNFIGMLIKKQRYLVKKIHYLTLTDVEERLYFFLKEQFGNIKRIVPNVNKKDVAAAIGTVPETLSRVLLRLKSENKLEWQGKEIIINPNWKMTSILDEEDQNILE